MYNASALQFAEPVSAEKISKKGIGKHCYFFKINIMTIGRGKTGRKKQFLQMQKADWGIFLRFQQEDAV